MDSLEAAIAYRDKGYRVFPCVGNGKTPATEHGFLDASDSEETLTRWFNEDGANIGIPTEGLFVLDVDGADNPWLSGLTEQQRDDLLTASIAKTPRGGCHYVFRQSVVAVSNSSGKIAEHVDVRANGGYIVVAPSTVNGTEYRWITELERRDRLPVVPVWLETLVLGKGKRKSIQAVAVTGEQIPAGKRNDTLFRWACAFRAYGMNLDEITASVGVVNRKRCVPPLEDAELATLCESAARLDTDGAKEVLVSVKPPVINGILSQSGKDEQVGTDEEVFIESVAPVFPTECFDEMPWLMRLAFDYIMVTALTPQPELALGALLAMFGTIFGRRVADDFDTRTNLYVLGLADSSVGKDHARKCVKQIMYYAGLNAMVGPERIGSHAGLVSSIAQHPVKLFLLDEIGRILQTMKNPEATHLYNVPTVLMHLYSSANTIWIGDAYADLAKVKTINQPHACVYGTTVPKHFYGALTPDSIEDGFLARLLVFSAAGAGALQKPEKLTPPWELTEAIKGFLVPTIGEGNLSTENPTPMTVHKTPEAAARHWQHTQEVHDRNEGDENIAKSTWRRAPEKSAKMALIYACCHNPMNPVIHLEAVTWGRKLANYTTRFVVHAIHERFAATKYHAAKLDLWEKIKHRMTLTALNRKTTSLRQRERMEMLADMQASGAIELKLENTEGRPRTIIHKLRGVL